MAETGVDAVELERVLTRVGERAQALDMGEVGQVLVTAVDDKIQNEGQDGVHPRWPELSDSTLARKGPGAKMLQGKTGQLASIQAVPEGEMSVLVFSPAPYAGHHVDPGESDRAMPRRDFFDLDFDAVLEQCGLRLLAHIDES